MHAPKISIIAALADKNRVIGKDNKLLWNIPEDMKHFREKTTGHVIIMGRKTYESVGKPLPNRINIVVSRHSDYKASGCFVVQSLEQALELAKEKEEKEVFVIGGGEIYKQALPFTDKLYLTVVQGDFEGDAFFPEFSEFSKPISVQVKHDANHKYAFVELERP